MGKQLIVCDTCFQSFEVGEAKVKEEKLTGHRTGMYFNCPRCGHKYPFASITDKGKQLKKRLERHVKRMESTEGADKIQMMEKQKEMLREYGKEVTGPYIEEEVVS